ncbi:MAG TPA: hypothetical protein GXX53_01170 [Tissierellia bacterium]|nr:hypothetical protein [Tissierellia bacterium]
MIRYNRLITFKVIDKYSNQPIGSIKDVLYSEDYSRVDYLIIKNNKLIRNKFIVEYDGLCFNKDNKVFLANRLDTVDNKLDRYIEKTIEGYKLINKEIKNEDGECIGFVRDVVINGKDGKVEGFIITEGLFEDLFYGRNYIPLIDTIYINEQCIFVPSNILSS